MKSTSIPRRLAVALACVAVAACADMKGDSAGLSGGGSSGSSAMGTQGSSGGYADSGSARTTTNSASSGSSTAGTSGGGSGSGSGSSMQSWRGIVQSIEPLTRQEAGIGVGGSVGAAAAGGSMGSAMANSMGGMGSASDRVYRVTLRTEGGGLQSVLVEAPPDYQVGDRVNYSDGKIMRQQ